MTLALIVLLPLAGALLPVWLGRWGREASALAAGGVTAASLALLVSLAGPALSGEVARTGVDWIPSVGLRFSLMLDGLGLLFAGLILGIGLLVILYARAYLAAGEPAGRFFGFLLLFMGAMLGVVLSENLILLVTFWELTSLSSFLLIGFWKHLPAARQGARQALTLTGLGGLGLLAGVLVLGQAAGTYELGELLIRGEALRAHPHYPIGLGLVLLGAFTKSAQFPFHFWLPHAMAAPTPVSAYLHSATMVKAGVFLLARLHPALAGSELWTFAVTGVGIATLLTGAYLANLAHDLKGLLAYSTISHLGLITALFGIGTREAAVAGVFHIMNHAAFKASLFMNAGIVDHEAGTRDIRALGGLARLMPITAGLAILASAAMAGLPPLNGFLSKEMFLEQTLHAPGFAGSPWLLPALATLGAALSVGYSIRYVIDVFVSKGPRALPPSRDHAPHDPPLGLYAPPAILVALCVAIGLAPNLVAGPLLHAAADATVGGGLPRPELHLWHGVTTALLLSGAAIVAGALIWRFRWSLIRAHEGPAPLPQGKRIFEAAVRSAVGLARRATDGAANGSLQRYLALLVATAVVIVGYGLVFGDVGTNLELAGSRPTLPATVPLALGTAMLLLTVVGTVLTHRKRLLAIVYISAVGLVMALAFVYFSAPDLALTQLSVEIVTIVLLLLALHLLPARTPAESSVTRRARDALVAVGAGGLFGLLTYMLLTRPTGAPVGLEHLRLSYPGGGGTNVVNVILVDFRGFDTFGEVAVLGIAALGIYALIDALGIPRHWSSDSANDEPGHPLLLVVCARLILPLALLVGLYIFLRGHNHPGGGFIAGLVVAIALILQYLASGIAWSQQRIRRNMHPLIAAGVLIATLTGAGAWLFGRPFLTSWFDYFELPLIGKFELASAMAFDTGVFLTVVGGVLLILVNLSKMPFAQGVPGGRPLTEEEP